MDQDVPLKISHDVSQTLQRKLEGKPGIQIIQSGFSHMLTPPFQVLVPSREPLSTSTTTMTMTLTRSTSRCTRRTGRGGH